MSVEYPELGGVPLSFTPLPAEFAEPGAAAALPTGIEYQPDGPSSGASAEELTGPLREPPAGCVPIAPIEEAEVVTDAAPILPDPEAIDITIDLGDVVTTGAAAAVTPERSRREVAILDAGDDTQEPEQLPAEKKPPADNTDVSCQTVQHSEKPKLAVAKATPPDGGKASENQVLQPAKEPPAPDNRRAAGVRSPEAAQPIRQQDIETDGVPPGKEQSPDVPVSGATEADTVVDEGLTPKEMAEEKANAFMSECTDAIDAAGEYPFDCANVAMNLASIFHDAGGKPYIAELRPRTGTDTLLPRFPENIRPPASGWDWHRVCVYEGNVYDPIIGRPAPIGDYVERAFDSPARTSQVIEEDELDQALQDFYRQYGTSEQTGEDDDSVHPADSIGTLSYIGESVDYLSEPGLVPRLTKTLQQELYTLQTAFSQGHLIDDMRQFTALLRSIPEEVVRSVAGYDETIDVRSGEGYAQTEICFGVPTNVWTKPVNASELEGEIVSALLNNYLSGQRDGESFARGMYLTQILLQKYTEYNGHAARGIQLLVQKLTQPEANNIDPRETQDLLRPGIGEAFGLNFGYRVIAFGFCHYAREQHNLELTPSAVLASLDHYVKFVASETHTPEEQIREDYIRYITTEVDMSWS